MTLNTQNLIQSKANLYAVSLEDLSIEAITSRDGPDHSPLVSPNGKLIAYRGYTDELKAYQQTDLYVMSEDGSDSKNLTEDYDHPIQAVQWLPNSRGLVAQASVEGFINLSLIHI